MAPSRRAFLQWSTAACSRGLFGQGVLDRHAHAQPRGPKSTLPFHAQLTDVAQAAGLHAPTVYGPLDHKDYFVGAVGCGSAFIDYDNDGWIDR